MMTEYSREIDENGDNVPYASESLQSVLDGVTAFAKLASYMDSPPNSIEWTQWKKGLAELARLAEESMKAQQDAE